MQNSFNSAKNLPNNITESSVMMVDNSVLKIIFISDNQDFIDSFFCASQHIKSVLINPEIISVQPNEFLSTEAFQSNDHCLIHLDIRKLNLENLKKIFEKLDAFKGQCTSDIILWGNESIETFPLSFFDTYAISDIRIINPHQNNWLMHSINASITNFIERLEVRQLKANIEKTISERTEHLTQLNKKLQGALVMNSNLNTKFHLKRQQIEQQNKEVTSYNDDLVKAFKKSSAQSIKLQKVLYLNEKQREELERVINETNEINQRLTAQNEEIKAQKEFIESQNEEIQAQRDMAIRQHLLIKEQQIEIQDNIQYSKHIQTALLPPNEFVHQLLPSHFIFNRPKDVVSGDFYWISQNKTKTILAVADCTGHGISGAMMSMLGTAFLNEIINNNDVTSATDILSQLRNRIISSLHQRIDGNIELSRDGMDISIVIIDIMDNTLEYAGANNPMYLFRQNELIEFKPDKMPIGIHEFCNEPFHSQTISLELNDMCYLFSDGYADQFGGQSGKKLKYNGFKQIISQIHHLPMLKQHHELERAFMDWKNTHDQIDDVLVFGFRCV